MWFPEAYELMDQKILFNRVQNLGNSQGNKKKG